MTLSIHHAAKRRKSLLSQRVARLDLQRFLEAAYGVAVHLFSKGRAAEGVGRKVTQLVAGLRRGLVEAGKRLVGSGRLAQIPARLRVRCSEARITPACML